MISLWLFFSDSPEKTLCNCFQSWVELPMTSKQIFMCKTGGAALLLRWREGVQTTQLLSDEVHWLQDHSLKEICDGSKWSRWSTKNTREVTANYVRFVHVQLVMELHEGHSSMSIPSTVSPHFCPLCSHDVCFVLDCLLPFSEPFFPCVLRILLSSPPISDSSPRYERTLLSATMRSDMFVASGTARDMVRTPNCST